MAHIIDLRADDAPGIEARVAVKMLILDGDEGLRHIFRQLVEIDRRRILAAAHRQHRA
jgi:hypothetical protein